MNHDLLNRKFRQALGLWRKGRLDKAALLLQQVIATGTEEPLYVSYYGLLTATVHGDRREGLRLCCRAMSFDPSDPDVAWNLSRLYEIGGENLKAIETLRRGLRASPRHPRLLAKINQLSPRKRPPLSMVDRDHALNKHLAIVMARLSGSYGKGAAPKKKKKKKAPTVRVVAPARS